MPFKSKKQVQVVREWLGRYFAPAYFLGPKEIFAGRMGSVGALFIQDRD